MILNILEGNIDKMRIMTHFNKDTVKTFERLCEIFLFNLNRFG